MDVAKAVVDHCEFEKTPDCAQEGVVGDAEVVGVACEHEPAHVVAE